MIMILVSILRGQIFLALGILQCPRWSAFLTHLYTHSHTHSCTYINFILTEDLDSRSTEGWLLAIRKGASLEPVGVTGGEWILLLFVIYQKHWITTGNILSLIPAWLKHWGLLFRNLKLILSPKSSTHVSFLPVSTFQETLPSFSHSVTPPHPHHIFIKFSGVQLSISDWGRLDW